MNGFIVGMAWVLELIVGAYALSFVPLAVLGVYLVMMVGRVAILALVKE